MADNIDDQNSSTSLMGLVSMFDLFSNENFDKGKRKTNNLYHLYGHDTVRKLEKYQPQIECKFMNTVKLATPL